MKKLHLLSLAVISLLVASCTDVPSKKKADQKAISSVISWEVVNHDTINRTDDRGKQGKWILFEHVGGKPNKVESGNYKNNEKDGPWEYYDSSGKVVRIVRFRNGMSYR